MVHRLFIIPMICSYYLYYQLKIHWEQRRLIDKNVVNVKKEKYKVITGVLLFFIMTLGAFYILKTNPFMVVLKIFSVKVDNGYVIKALVLGAILSNAFLLLFIVQMMMVFIQSFVLENNPFVFILKMMIYGYVKNFWKYFFLNLTYFISSLIFTVLFLVIPIIWYFSMFLFLVIFCLVFFTDTQLIYFYYDIKNRESVS